MRVADAIPAGGVDITLTTESHVVSAKVTPGATLASLLRDHDVAEADVTDAVVQARALFDLRKVRSDQAYLWRRAPTDHCAASNTKSMATGS